MKDVAFTNLEKPLWADGTTKGALIEYLIAIAPVMLPHLAGRPLTLKRFPDGVEAKGFFEKNAPSHRPDWVATATVTERDEAATYVVADRPETLAWLGQLAAVEIHAPLARATSFDHPDLLVFDLDPGPPATLDACLEVAVVLEALFGQLGLRSCPKTSGAKGLQVYVPIDPTGVTFAETSGFAHEVAQTLELQLPDLVVSRQSKAIRGGKVLVDWYQNGRGRTTIAAYSARPGPKPGVSTPISWAELHAARDAGDAERLRFGLSEVVGRVAEHGDLFAPCREHTQRLPRLT